MYESPTLLTHGKTAKYLINTHFIVIKKLERPCLAMVNNYDYCVIRNIIVFFARFNTAVSVSIFSKNNNYDK